MRTFMIFLAVAGSLFAVSQAQVLQPPTPVREPASPPATCSVETPQICGVGIVEPPGESIAVASALSGVVAEVKVEPGQNVQQDEILFRLDDCELQAELSTREAELAVAQARLARLRSLPRTEEVPVTEAKVEAAKAAWTAAEDRHQRAVELVRKEALPAEEAMNRQQEAQRTAAILRQMQAELLLLKAGASRAEIEVAEAEVTHAAAAVNRLVVAIRRMVVRAPAAGRVLRVNVRRGEHVPASRADEPLILFARSGPLRVRAEFDEGEIRYARQVAAGEAWARGRSRERFSLKRLYTEPFVRPKRSLTGNSTERVDTRVLIVVFELEGAAPAVEVGQQLDVFAFIEPTVPAG